MQLMSARARQGRKVSGKRWRDADADRRTERAPVDLPFSRPLSVRRRLRLMVRRLVLLWETPSCSKCRRAPPALNSIAPPHNPRPQWKSAPFYWPLSSSPLPVSTHNNFFLPKIVIGKINPVRKLDGKGHQKWKTINVIDWSKKK
jgi:hypothetical protein